MNLSFGSNLSLGTHGGMVIRNGSQIIKTSRSGTIVENPAGQQVVMDNSGIHIYNGNIHVFVNSNSVNIQTNFRAQTEESEGEEFMSNDSTTTAGSSVEGSPIASADSPAEESQSRGFNYRISSNNILWHSSQHINPLDAHSNSFEYRPRPEPAKKQGLTKAQIRRLPVTLYNSKASRLKMAKEKKEGKCCESLNPSTNDSCAICLLDYTIGDKLTSLPCFHKFHKKCVSKWLELKSDCPCCKFDLLD